MNESEPIVLVLKSTQFMNAKETRMKNSRKAAFLALAAGVALAVMVVPAAQAHAKRCSNTTLKGTYADKDTGTIINVGPFVGVNVDTFDGNGNMTISGTSSVNGNVFPGAETGTYQVNADCTGTYTVEDSFGDVFHAYFVIDDSGNELQIVITDPGTAITCVAKKQFPLDND